MTLLPGVRDQIRDAADRQSRSRRRVFGGGGAGAGAARPRLALVAPILGVVVVVVVAAIFISTGGTGRSSGSGTVRVVLRALPTAPSPILSATDVARAAAIMRQRVGAAFHDAQVSVSGSTVTVVAHDAGAGAGARILALSTPGRLAFYDWEANVLTARGHTVASRLQTLDPTAIAISQGLGPSAPGAAGAGSMTLYDAVRLAARQPAHVSPDNARMGSQYYLFGAPGGAACATAARDQGVAPKPGVHCLLAGPAASRQELLAGMPAGVSASQGRELVVKPGTVVLQAADLSGTHQTSLSDPGAQFFVLTDHAALQVNDITSPRQSTDAAGNPDVTFGFTLRGAALFQQITSTLARRGALDSGLSQMLEQHFAVALDDKLLTVPSVDFKNYPDGIPGTDGADLAGGFTAQSVRDLVAQLRFGPLPVTLAPQ